MRDHPGLPGPGLPRAPSFPFRLQQDTPRARPSFPEHERRKGLVLRNPTSGRPAQTEVAESARHDIDFAVPVEITEPDRGIVACLTFERMTSKFPRPGLFEEDYGVGSDRLSHLAVIRFAQEAGGHDVQIAIAVDISAHRAVAP